MLPLILSMISFLLAAIIFVFTDGAKSIYSGVFFVVIGGVLLANSWRTRGNRPEQSPLK
jgi:hypothetical protein